MLLDIILLALSPRIYAYDFTSCDMSCDCSHMSLHHPRNKKNKNKRKIKSRKIDKKKRKSK